MSKHEGAGKQAGPGKPFKKQHPGGVHKPKAAGGNADSNSKAQTHRRDRIRLLQHMLKKEDLAPATRAGIEKELQQLEEAKKADAAKERERKLAVKYHKVRFFERVKIERHIHKLEHTISGQAGGQATKEQQTELDRWQRYLTYVRNYPPGHKYVSLLKDADTPEAQAQLEAKRAEMFALVDQRLAAARLAELDKAALTEADEGGAAAAALVAAAAAKALGSQSAATGKPNKPAAATAAASRETGKAGPTGKAGAKEKTAGLQVKSAGPGKPEAQATLDGSDDDFFMSDDDDEDAAGMRARQTGLQVKGGVKDTRSGAGAAQGTQRPAAKSWARPEGMDAGSSSEESGDDDDGDDGSDAEQARKGGRAGDGGRAQGGKDGVPGSRQDRVAGAPGKRLAQTDDVGAQDRKRRRRRGTDKAGGAAAGAESRGRPAQGKHRADGQGEAAEGKRKRRRRSKKSGSAGAE